MGGRREHTPARKLAKLALLQNGGEIDRRQRTVVPFRGTECFELRSFPWGVRYAARIVRNVLKTVRRDLPASPGRKRAVNSSNVALARAQGRYRRSHANGYHRRCQ